MKVVQINSFSNGSTGKIMMSIHKELLKQGHDSYVIWGRGRKAKNENEIYLNNKVGVWFHVIYSRLTGKAGFASKRITKKLIKKIDNINPDIIHLHNIHGYYLNIELLFNYLKKNNVKVIWTLHDCWAFTGHCAYFDFVKCDRWKTECYECPLINEYPKSIKDNSKQNYKEKKEIFTGVSNLTIVTPSKWLKKQVKESFLKDYNSIVIYNGVNTQIFKPSKCDFREKYGLKEKKIILGVASVWDRRKGLSDFIKLSNVLDENYKIVLVGLSDRQLSQLPNNIIGIKRIENSSELAELYTTADIFFNASVEETFGLTTIEAICCGTPVIVYNKTALSEIVDNNVGIVLKEKDYDQIKEIIQKNLIKNINKKELITYIKKYNLNNMILNYLELYKNN